MTTLLSSTWARFRTNLKDPVLRRNIVFYMGGKLLGLARCYSEHPCNLIVYLRFNPRLFAMEASTRRLGRSRGRIQLKSGRGTALYP